MVPAAKAWIPSTNCRNYALRLQQPHLVWVWSRAHHNVKNGLQGRLGSVELFESSSSVQDESSSSSSSAVDSDSLSEEEANMVKDIYEKYCDEDTEQNTLKKALLEVLPTWPAKMIVKLRQSESDDDLAIRTVSRQLNELLQESLEQAKGTLLQLLNAGEVRKLDSLIGKAARENRLDVAFFNVLSMNIRDAAEQEQAAEQNDASQSNNETDEAPASRLQILQHVYTRCQEEVEKLIPPGMALLNKLLRTDQEAIRANLYRHYLTPQQSTIETPDGKKIELPVSQSSVLVPLDDFIKAIETAVLQIRTVEKAGAANPTSGAAMVESCRQIAKEARVVIGESYGAESDELNSFEEGLMPVFRPSSPTSPFIQGQS